MFCTVWLIQFWNINTVHCSLNKKKNQGSVFLKILFRFKVVNSPISELSFLSECRYFDYKLIFTLWHSPPPPLPGQNVYSYKFPWQLCFNDK